MEINWTELNSTVHAKRLDLFEHLCETLGEDFFYYTQSKNQKSILVYNEDKHIKMLVNTTHHSDGWDIKSIDITDQSENLEETIFLVNPLYIKN